MTDKYGEYTICIRPPTPPRLSCYWVRVFDKDMKVLDDPNSPIGFYDAEYPNRRVYNRDDFAVWTGCQNRRYFLKDGEKIICEFGGETIVRALPYRSVTKGDKFDL